LLSLLASATPALGLVLMLVVPAAQAATIGYWRFEEGTPPSPATAPNSVLDSSGHGLDATPVGGPLYSSSLPPGAATVGSTRSMQFNGWGQRLVVPDSPVLQLTRSLTIEAFLKPEPLLPGTANVGQVLFRSDNRPGLDPYSLAFEGSGNLLVFQIQDAAQNVARVQVSVPLDQWLFVAGTLDDATGQMKLFVNGQLVNSTTTSVRPLGALDPAWGSGLSLGGDPTGQYGEYFNGWLDEVRLSDVALAPSQFLIPVPEPSTSLLFALAAGAWLISRRVQRVR
jgi:hypothetical protein